MEKIISVLPLILSASFFAGCAANVDSDEDFETEDAQMADEDVGSAASALTLTCAQWTPSPGVCAIASRDCGNEGPTEHSMACPTLMQCFKCGVEWEGNP